MLGEPLKVVVGQYLAGLEVPVGAQLVVGDLEGEPLGVGHGIEGHECALDDLGTDAVPGYYRDAAVPHFLHHQNDWASSAARRVLTLVARLTAFRNARAEPSTTSVETPLPE